jgi:hypothetical protein
MISELNKNKIIRIRHHLEIIYKEGLSIIENNRENLSVYESFFERYIFSFESIYTLLKGFSVDKKFRSYSMALILRACLLDSLIILYLKTFYVEKKAGIITEEGNYKEEYEKLLSEQLRRLLNSINKERKNSKEQTENYKNLIDKIYSNFIYLFDKGKKLDYNKPEKALKYNGSHDIKPEVIKKRLDKFKNNLKGIDYEEASNLYNLFSKQDHFGIISILLSKQEINEISEDIIISLFHITDGFSFCLDFLYEEGKNKFEYKNIENEISYLRGTISTKHLRVSEKYEDEYK